MKRVALLALLFTPHLAWGQSSIGDQINAVDSAQQRHDYMAQQAWQAQARQQAAAQAAAQASRRRAQAAANAREAERQRRLDARQARDDAYEDKLRDLELQERSLDVQSKKTVVSRQNDIIDSNIRSQDASTDLTHSKADANRSVSQGTKTLLEKQGSQAELEGQAAVKKESGWFSR